MIGIIKHRSKHHTMPVSKRKTFAARSYGPVYGRIAPYSSGELSGVKRVIVAIGNIQQYPAFVSELIFVLIQSKQIVIQNDFGDYTVISVQVFGHIGTGYRIYQVTLVAEFIGAGLQDLIILPGIVSHYILLKDCQVRHFSISQIEQGVAVSLIIGISQGKIGHNLNAL